MRVRSVAWLVVLATAGCTDIAWPNLHRFMRHPWTSREQVQLGESQAAVLKRWGPPTERRLLSIDRLGMRREEWVYRAALESLPIDYMYLSRTQHLIFDGNNLMRWFEE